MTSDSKEKVKPYRPTTSELLQEQLPHNSYYYPGFWGSYKGYVKGALGGIGIGGVLGALIGLSAFGIATMLVPAAALSITSLVLPMTVLGMMKGYHEFSSIGSSAGTGVALDELEVRQSRALNKKLELLYGKMGHLVGKQDEVEADIATHPFTAADDNNGTHTQGETPHQDAATHKTTKLFHWRVALLGLAIGVAVGALLAFGAPMVAGHVFIGLAEAGAGHGLIAGAGAAITAACGLFGASFGIDRIFYRKMFDFTDRLFYGEVGYHKSADTSPEVAHEPAKSQAVEPAKAAAVAPAATVETENAPAVTEQLPNNERVVVVKHTETIVTKKKQGNWRDFTEAQKALTDLDPNTSIRH